MAGNGCTISDSTTYPDSRWQESGAARERLWRHAAYLYRNIERQKLRLQQE